MIKLKNNRKYLKIVFAFMVFIFLLSLTIVLVEKYNENVESEKLDVTMRIGNEIIIALDKYKKDHGKYPESLSELLPSYVSEIHDPLWGDKKWGYETRSNNDDFLLVVFKNNGGYASYESSYERWSFLDITEF